jgi:hypothetical protein
MNPDLQINAPKISFTASFFPAACSLVYFDVFESSQQGGASSLPITNHEVFILSRRGGDRGPLRAGGF